MPWCENCNRYLTPNTMSKHGHCPSCEGEVDTPEGHGEPAPKIPWHFWLMIIALTIYLGWRLVQLIALLF